MNKKLVILSIVGAALLLVSQCYVPVKVISKTYYYHLDYDILNAVTPFGDTVQILGKLRGPNELPFWAVMVTWDYDPEGITGHIYGEVD